MVDKWISVEVMTPPYGEVVEVKQDWEGFTEDEVFDASFEENTCCMLGRRNGSFGEGFQDDYNHLACPDVTHWRAKRDPESEVNDE